MKTGFASNPGKYGKYFEKYLEPELWDLLQKTYTDAGYDNTWEALFAMCDLFRMTALRVAEHFGFDYNHDDDKRVTVHLRHVRLLPKNAAEMY